MGYLDVCNIRWHDVWRGSCLFSFAFCRPVGLAAAELSLTVVGLAVFALPCLVNSDVDPPRLPKNSFAFTILRHRISCARAASAWPPRLTAPGILVQTNEVGFFFSHGPTELCSVFGLYDKSLTRVPLPRS